jgi:hypothetical protein
MGFLGVLSGSIESISMEKRNYDRKFSNIGYG